IPEHYGMIQENRDRLLKNRMLKGKEKLSSDDEETDPVISIVKQKLDHIDTAID
ncbi:hypothetical protein KI387_010399, partial [Taxus chinensis]